MPEPVTIEQFYLACLAHASYLISSRGEAAVIDPQRDVDLYLEAAARQGAAIRHIIETHLHADFVSGHLELARRTGAQIYLGEGSGADFPHRAVKEGDAIQFGDCRLEFLQTPGHTLESVCVVLTDLTQPAAPRAVFTGDTLFVGDVGRPDLSPTHTPQQLARELYHSLQGKLLRLPDATEIFPAHGAGSLCGRQMSAERSSTIGRERRFNYALQAANAEEFVHLVADDLPPRPEYFGRDVELNRHGAAAVGELPQLAALQTAEVRALVAEGAIVLDTRPPADFAAAHIPGSVNIALGGQFASWAGRIVGLDRRLVLLAEDAARVREAQVRLARVGIERVEGYVDDGIAGWLRGGGELESLLTVAAQDLAGLREERKSHITVLDVREPSEREAGAIPGSIGIPLGQLPARLDEIGRSQTVVVHCKSGYRSSIAASLLQRSGVREVGTLTGGFDAWKAIAPR
ncbi:MAG TPA: MBL fold metallo-hydrolase [Bryobacteraceae bacterium]|jgi:glyoxylase-like metal-dependent hydrolase (beta-lactamase superfamily II)/rhodanese-related sulfurtransferase|nr:MBL fold metallo-hydrolase [Bryobacteraceae bacterium]